MATVTEHPIVATLKTPMSATYPSEIPSPMDPPPALIKLEEGASFQSQKTPISPPLAYLDFLKALSPSLSTPKSAERMSFPPRPSTLSSTDSSDTVVTLSSDASDTSSTAGPSRKSSLDSQQSAASTSTQPEESAAPAAPRSNISSSRKSPRSSLHLRRDSQQERPAAINTSKSDSRMKISIPPVSPFVRGASTKTPRRLNIATSSPSAAEIPISAGIRTPLSAGPLRTPLSAHSVRSPYRVMAMSPKDGATYELKSPYAGGPTIKSGSFGMRQVVTRTVIYSNKPTPVVDPVPPSKKRRVE